MNKESRNFGDLRGLVSRMSLLAALGLSLAASGSGVEDGTQKYKSSAPVAPTTPREAPRLRLQGVASIGQQETAYFVHTENGLVFGLGVGESLWNEYKLVRIIDGEHYLRCKAELSHNGMLFQIAIENFMDQSAPSAQPAQSATAVESDGPSVERVAVRPWVAPKK
ncbi:MAG: hypothetical protein JNJ83_02215 [Verrucomicrobiaceae bacterium]|nr:hypothetical protein [Verrucomicrobiaceae bacterium]